MLSRMHIQYVMKRFVTAYLLMQILENPLIAHIAICNNSA